MRVRFPPLVLLFLHWVNKVGNNKPLLKHNKQVLLSFDSGDLDRLYSTLSEYGVPLAEVHLETCVFASPEQSIDFYMGDRVKFNVYQDSEEAGALEIIGFVIASVKFVIYPLLTSRQVESLEFVEEIHKIPTLLLEDFFFVPLSRLYDLHDAGYKEYVEYDFG